jgi:hypothetical protein
LLHAFGDQQEHIFFPGDALGEGLVLIVGDEFAHVLAFEEEVVVFADGHEKVAGAVPLVAAELDPLEMRLRYLETLADVLNDVSGSIVQQLQLVVALLHLAVLYFWGSASAICTHSVLVLRLDLVQLIGIVLLEEQDVGTTAPQLAL